MNAFEELVAGLLRRDGYWTHHSYKVALTKAEKRSIGKPSLPRIEIDLLAYRATTNSLLWVECKSYLDSTGVKTSDFSKADGRYKVFANRDLRELATAKLIEQAVDQGLARPNPEVEYWLVAGHVAPKSRETLEELFKREGWHLRAETWLRDHLAGMADADYEDDVAIMVAKLVAPKEW